MALKEERFVNKKNGREVLTVTHNSDLQQYSNANYADELRGSFREAIQYTQANPREQGYEIVFVNPSAALREQGINLDPLGIGYWTIELSRALPNIYRGDVVINPDATMNITLAPSGLKKANEGYAKLAGVANQEDAATKNGAGSSILVVGDARYTGYGAPANEDVELELNRINFVGNHARGSDALGFGGGGGGAAGGAVILIDGKLTVNQSNFQTLRASGGSGQRRASAGRNYTYKPKKNSSRGEDGGAGGYFSTPLLRQDDSGTLAWDTPNHGGYGRKAGHVPKGYPDRNRQARGFDGLNGDPAQFPDSRSPKLGYGGGGGGGGGGAGGYKKSFKGTAGKGGRAGHGDGWLGGDGLGGNGSDRNLAVDYTRPGKGIGAAIAILGQRFNREPSLYLNQVDILDSGQNIDNAIYADGDDKNRIYTVDSRFGEPYVDGAGGQNVKKKITKFNNDYSPTPRGLTGTFPYVQLASSPRKRNILDAREIEVTARDNIIDIFMLAHEHQSTVVGVTANLADPDHPMNQLWGTLYEQQEGNILAQYEADAQASKFNYGDLALDAAKFALKKGCELGAAKATGSTHVAKASGMACDKAWNFAEDLITAPAKRAEVSKKRNDAIQNQRNEWKQIQDILNKNSSAVIGTVDVGIGRTRNVIRNFTLGEDILLLPRSNDDQKRLQVASTAEGRSGKMQFSLGYDSTESTDHNFLTVELSKESSDELGPLSSLERYVSMLIKQSEGIWGEEEAKYSLIGQSIPSEQKHTGGEVYGPAGEYITVNREVDSLWGTVVEVNSKAGNDIVDGTGGDERINTGQGHDHIFPVYGADTVNGGKGEDVVDYRLLNAPLGFEGITTASRSMSLIEVTKLTDSESQCTDSEFDFDVDAELLNVEGIHAFSGSKIDFADLPDPSLYGMGVYKAVLGAGSRFDGSKYSDYVVVDFSKYYNCDSGEAFKSYTELSGGGCKFDDCIDLLELDLSDYEGSEAIRTEYLDDSDIYKVFVGDHLALKATGFEVSEYEANDASEVVSFKGSEIPHLHKAQAGDDRVFGGSKSDQLFGNAGSDLLRGFGGSDILRGGSGHDFLDGGAGSDVLIGGKGADVFRLSPGRDRVKEFSPGEDVIQAAVVPEIEPRRKGVVLTYAGGETWLKNVSVQDVDNWLTLDAEGLEILA